MEWLFWTSTTTQDQKIQTALSVELALIYTRIQNDRRQLFGRLNKKSFSKITKSRNMKKWYFIIHSQYGLHKDHQPAWGIWCCQYLISRRESLLILIMSEVSSVSIPNIAKSCHTRNCSYRKLIKNRFKVNQGHPRPLTHDEESRIRNMIFYHYESMTYDSPKISVSRSSKVIRGNKCSSCSKAR